jgi:hypothetical protein
MTLYNLYLMTVYCLHGAVPIALILNHVFTFNHPLQTLFGHPYYVCYSLLAR